MSRGNAQTLMDALVGTYDAEGELSADIAELDRQEPPPFPDVFEVRLTPSAWDDAAIEVELQGQVRQPGPDPHGPTDVYFYILSLDFESDGNLIALVLTYPPGPNQSVTAGVLTRDPLPFLDAVVGQVFESPSKDGAHRVASRRVATNRYELTVEPGASGGKDWLRRARFDLDLCSSGEGITWIGVKLLLSNDYGNVHVELSLRRDTAA